MRCPACDEKISDGAWMCPHCEHIIDASFLGNDITNEGGWADGLDPEASTFESPPPKKKAKAMEPPPEPPTDGLDVHDQMIVESLEDELPEPPTDDIAPLVREVRSLGAPKNVDDRIDTKPLPEDLPSDALKPIDPALLAEIEAAEPAPLMIDEPKKRGLPPLKKAEPAEDQDSKKREVLTRAMARGPVQERRRSIADEPIVTPAGSSSPSPTPSIPPAATTSVPRSDPRSREVPVMVRSSKAEKIFQQALEDIEAGNLVSARTNVKLAMTFDPGNERYAAKLEQIMDEVGPSPSQDLEEVPKGQQFASQFYEKAVDQENQGNFDEAIRLLEKAIRSDPQGVYYHRLGTILAFRQGKLKEGRTMVDKAIQRSPKNKNYHKTLSRILDKLSGDNGEKRSNMGNMLGGLLKRK